MSGRAETTVFVFGALRSGTTMFRLMLNSHPEIHNPGEVDFLFDYLAPDPAHATGWRYDLEGLAGNRGFQARELRLTPGVDGRDLLIDLLEQLAARGQGVPTLNVHRHPGRIAALLPKARFIHLIRDGRDVARSSIGMGWSGTSWRGIDHWIETERAWDRAAIAPQAVLALRFEDLMTDLDTHMRRVCDFLGVAFSRDMLLYHENSTYGPPDPGIVQQWKRKSGAREIALLEGRCADLLEARGYALNGAPVRPGSLVRALLTLKDRWLRYRFNIRRYGPVLFFQAHLVRHLGLKRMERRVQARINAKTVEFLQ